MKLSPDMARIFELIPETKSNTQTQESNWKWIKCNFCSAEYPVGKDDYSHNEEGGHCEICYKQDWSEVAE